MKTVTVGSLVQYVGNVAEMAGLQGPIATIENGAATVLWFGRFGHVAKFDGVAVQPTEIKPIRKFSKGIRVA